MPTVSNLNDQQNPSKEVQFNYQAEAQLTCSDKFYGEKLDLAGLLEVFNGCIAWLNYLDNAKKALFYGKMDNLAYPLSLEEYPLINAGKIHEAFGPNGIQILHSIIGKATECGELLELAVATIKGAPFDETNFKEEIGDGLWYDAIGLNAVGSNFEESQRTNIAKLRARYGEKFTEYDANNRNLIVERKILES